MCRFFLWNHEMGSIVQALKRLNNNAVLIEDDGRECVVTGKGVGFGVNPGDEICQTKIEKLFSLAGTSPQHMQGSYLESLLGSIPTEFLDIAQRTLDYSKVALSCEFRVNVLLPLADHLWGATIRRKAGADTPNMLANEIRRLYPSEFAAGAFALELVERSQHVVLDEGEAAFVALYLISAQAGTQSERTAKIVEIISCFEEFVSNYLHIEVDPDCLDYQRFLTHVRFFAQRIVENNTPDSTQDQSALDEMLAGIVERYPQVVSCTEALSAMLVARFSYRVKAADKLYLSVHLARLVEVKQHK